MNKNKFSFLNSLTKRLNLKDGIFNDDSKIIKKRIIKKIKISIIQNEINKLKKLKEKNAIKKSN